MYFEPNPVDSKAEKQAFLSNKIKDNGEFEGSDPTGMNSARFPHLADAAPLYREFRSGDVRHSLADIIKARTLLGYAPTHTIHQGLESALGWYIDNLKRPYTNA
jgi:nucleoside-diphosphate-sugar epimerase